MCNFNRLANEPSIQNKPKEMYSDFENVHEKKKANFEQSEGQNEQIKTDKIL